MNRMKPTRKIIDGFIDTKKVGWNDQPTKCQLHHIFLYALNKLLS